MIPIMLLVLIINNQEGLEIKTEKIEFRTLESCERESQKIKHETKELKIKAFCIDRSNEQDLIDYSSR